MTYFPLTQDGADSARKWLMEVGKLRQFEAATCDPRPPSSPTHALVMYANVLRARLEKARG